MPSGELYSAFADFGIESVWKIENEIRFGLRKRCPDFGFRSFRLASVGEIVADGAVEYRGILGQVSYVRIERRKVHAFRIESVDGNRTGSRKQESARELYDRRLSGSGFPHERVPLTGFENEIEAGNDVPSFGVRERNVREDDLSGVESEFFSGGEIRRFGRSIEAVPKLFDIDDVVGKTDVRFGNVGNGARKDSDQGDEEDDFGKFDRPGKIGMTEFPIRKGDDGVSKHPDSLEDEHLRSELNAVGHSIFFDFSIEGGNFRISGEGLHDLDSGMYGADKPAVVFGNGSRPGFLRVFPS